MIFSKTGRLTKDQFQFVICGEDLESVGQYKYFGLTFSNRANFQLQKRT